MKSMLSVVVVLFGLLAGQLVTENDALQHERAELLKTVATEMAHEAIDAEDRYVVGEISVTSLGGARYRASGTAISHGKMVNWNFRFFSDIPAVPSKLEMHVDGDPAEHSNPTP